MRYHETDSPQALECSPPANMIDTNSFAIPIYTAAATVTHLLIATCMATRQGLGLGLVEHVSYLLNCSYIRSSIFRK